MKLDMPQRKTRLGEILKKTDFWGFSTASLGIHASAGFKTRRYEFNGMALYDVLKIHISFRLSGHMVLETKYSSGPIRRNDAPSN